MNSSTEKSADREKHSGFQQDLDSLRQIPLFQGLDYECLKLIAMLSKRIDLIEGDLLMVEGEDDGNGYYLISGILKSFYKKDSIEYQVQNYKPGQFIGGLALLGKSIRLFTVYAAEQSTVLRLNREGFQKIMQQFPNSMTKIAANMALELAGWEKDLLARADEKELEGENQVLGISLL